MSTLPRSLSSRNVEFLPLNENKAVMEEGEKLLTAGFIREVYYPKWLANVVMVKKSNGKWCIYAWTLQILTEPALRTVFHFPGSISWWTQQPARSC